MQTVLFLRKKIRVYKTFFFLFLSLELLKPNDSILKYTCLFIRETVKTNAVADVVHQQRARIARAGPTRLYIRYYRTITAVEAATFLRRRLQNAARGGGGGKRHFWALKQLPCESVCSEEDGLRFVLFFFLKSFKCF